MTRIVPLLVIVPKPLLTLSRLLLPTSMEKMDWLSTKTLSAVTAPPPRMLRVPLPPMALQPMVRSLLFVHFEPDPSTVTSPFVEPLHPIKPDELVTAPPLAILRVPVPPAPT